MAEARNSRSGTVKVWPVEVSRRVKEASCPGEGLGEGEAEGGEEGGEEGIAWPERKPGGEEGEGEGAEETEGARGEK